MLCLAMGVGCCGPRGVMIFLVKQAHLLKIWSCNANFTILSIISSLTNSWERCAILEMKFILDGKPLLMALLNLMWMNKTCGGVLHDHVGRWIYGFARNMGRSTITMAELRAILDAIELSCRLGVGKVEIESESSSTLEFT